MDFYLAGKERNALSYSGSATPSNGMAPVAHPQLVINRPEGGRYRIAPRAGLTPPRTALSPPGALRAVQFRSRLPETGSEQPQTLQQRTPQQFQPYPLPRLQSSASTPTMPLRSASTPRMPLRGGSLLSTARPSEQEACEERVAVSSARAPPSMSFEERIADALSDLFGGKSESRSSEQFQVKSSNSQPNGVASNGASEESWNPADDALRRAKVSSLRLELREANASLARAQRPDHAIENLQVEVARAADTLSQVQSRQKMIEDSIAAGRREAQVLEQSLAEKRETHRRLQQKHEQQRALLSNADTVASRLRLANQDLASRIEAARRKLPLQKVSVMSEEAKGFGGSSPSQNLLGPFEAIGEALGAFLDPQSSSNVSSRTGQRPLGAGGQPLYQQGMVEEKSTLTPPVASLSSSRGAIVVEEKPALTPPVASRSLEAIPEVQSPIKESASSKSPHAQFLIDKIEREVEQKKQELLKTDWQTEALEKMDEKERAVEKVRQALLKLEAFATLDEDQPIELTRTHTREPSLATLNGSREAFKDSSSRPGEEPANALQAPEASNAEIDHSVRTLDPLTPTGEGDEIPEDVTRRAGQTWVRSDQDNAELPVFFREEEAPIPGPELIPELIPEYQVSIKSPSDISPDVLPVVTCAEVPYTWQDKDDHSENCSPRSQVSRGRDLSNFSPASYSRRPRFWSDDGSGADTPNSFMRLPVSRDEHDDIDKGDVDTQIAVALGAMIGNADRQAQEIQSYEENMQILRNRMDELKARVETAEASESGMRQELKNMQDQFAHMTIELRAAHAERADRQASVQMQVSSSQSQSTSHTPRTPMTNYRSTHIAKEPEKKTDEAHLIYIM